MPFLIAKGETEAQRGQPAPSYLSALKANASLSAMHIPRDAAPLFPEPRSPAVFRIQHISLLTCHRLVYSMLGSPGGFANTAHSCPARPLLFQSCCLQLPQVSLSLILPAAAVSCRDRVELQQQGQVTLWLGHKVSPPGMGREGKSRLSCPITFFPG